MQLWGRTSRFRDVFFQPSAFERGMGSLPSNNINIARVTTILRPALVRLNTYLKIQDIKPTTASQFLSFLDSLENGLPSPFAAHMELRATHVFTPKDMTMAGSADQPLLLAMVYYELLCVVLDLACPSLSCLREVAKALAVRRMHARIIQKGKSDNKQTLEAIDLSRIADGLATELLEKGTMGIATQPEAAASPDSVYVVRWV